MLFLSVISFSSLLEFHSSMERVAGKQHHFFLKSVKKKFLLVENLIVLTIYVIINRSLRGVSAECSG